MSSSGSSAVGGTYAVRSVGVSGAELLVGVVLACGPLAAGFRRVVVTDLF
jgi:hypothetical protein